MSDVGCLQDQHGGVLDSPPAVEELAADPLLADCKLIAASANNALLPRSGDRGFPHYGVLLEWNNRFGSDLLTLLRDNQGGPASAGIVTVGPLTALYFVG